MGDPLLDIVSLRNEITAKDETIARLIEELEAKKPSKRRSLPPRRVGYNQKVVIGGHTLYVRTGEYEDGSLGEIFLDISKTGAALRALLNAFAISISLGLQHGTPLAKYISSFKNFRFEPCGEVHGDSRITEVASLIDYVFRELEQTYLLNNLPPDPKAIVEKPVPGVGEGNEGRE